MSLNIKKALIVEPHPDDFILMFAGTAKRLANEGKEVYVLTFTNGGSVRADVAQAKLERSAETAEADKVIGTTSREILDYNTRSGLDSTRQLYEDIIRRVRAVSPDVIITTHNDRRHPDHGWIADNIERLVFQAGENIKLDWGQPVKVPRIWLGENPRNYLANPNILVDISETFKDKDAALRTQTSQIPVLGQQIFSDIEALAKFRAVGTDAKYCEAFQEVQVYRTAL